MTLKKLRKPKSRLESKVIPVFAFSLLKLGQMFCVIPYYIRIEDSFYLGKLYINLLENWYKMRNLIA